MQTGTLIELGRHRLLCGDSKNPNHMATLMRGHSADAVVTDPPYNVDYTNSKGAIMNDCLSERRFKGLLFDAFSNAIDHSKRGAAFYAFAGATSIDVSINAMKDAGWIVRQSLIWQKHHFALSRQPYHWKHEMILFGAAPGASSPWYSDRKQTTILPFAVETKGRVHPTQKPKALIKYLIGNSTKEGDVVLDPFGGSGTTLFACEEMGRIAMICDTDPKWCESIVERWNEMQEGVREVG